MTKLTYAQLAPSVMRKFDALNGIITKYNTKLTKSEFIKLMKKFKFYASHVKYAHINFGHSYKKFVTPQGFKLTPLLEFMWKWYRKGERIVLSAPNRRINQAYIQSTLREVRNDTPYKKRKYM